MTVEQIERLAEQAARAHLQEWHPAVTAAYSTGVPCEAILLDLREVGMCTCPAVGREGQPSGAEPAVPSAAGSWWRPDTPSLR